MRSKLRGHEIATFRLAPTSRWASCFWTKIEWCCCFEGTNYDDRRTESDQRLVMMMLSLTRRQFSLWTSRQPSDDSNRLCRRDKSQTKVRLTVVINQVGILGLFYRERLHLDNEHSLWRRRVQALSVFPHTNTVIMYCEMDKQQKNKCHLFCAAKLEPAGVWH